MPILCALYFPFAVVLFVTTLVADSFKVEISVMVMEVVPVGT